MTNDKQDREPGKIRPPFPRKVKKVGSGVLLSPTVYAKTIILRGTKTNHLITVFLFHSDKNNEMEGNDNSPWLKNFWFSSR